MAPTHTVYGSASPECPRIAFIVAPPRSGTTILEEILGAHPEVGHFYEPYYIWYYHAKNLANDCIAIEDIGPTEADWIRRQFKTFSRAARKGIIIEKSPEHSLNLPVVRYVFPQAKIIHIIRVLSARMHSRGGRGWSPGRFRASRCGRRLVGG